MNSCKRSVMAVAMLVLISLPAGLFLTWKIQQLVQKQEMMEKLEHAELQTITLPASSVQWYEEDKEIIVDGRLFDVKSWRQLPGTINVSFTGLFDDAETEIEEKVKNLLNQKGKNNPGKKLLAWLFFCPLEDNETMAERYNGAGPDFTLYITHSIAIPDLSTPAPPPRA